MIAAHTSIVTSTDISIVSVYDQEAILRRVHVADDLAILTASSAAIEHILAPGGAGDYLGKGA